MTDDRDLFDIIVNGQPSDEPVYDDAYQAEEDRIYENLRRRLEREEDQKQAHSESTRDI